MTQPEYEKAFEKAWAKANLELNILPLNEIGRFMFDSGIAYEKARECVWRHGKAGEYGGPSSYQTQCKMQFAAGERYTFCQECGGRIRIEDIP